jgi:hypothetical protein
VINEKLAARIAAARAAVQNPALRAAMPKAPIVGKPWVECKDLSVFHVGSVKPVHPLNGPADRQAPYWAKYWSREDGIYGAIRPGAFYRFEVKFHRFLPFCAVRMLVKFKLRLSKTWFAKHIPLGYLKHEG